MAKEGRSGFLQLAEKCYIVPLWQFLCSGTDAGVLIRRIRHIFNYLLPQASDNVCV